MQSFQSRPSSPDALPPRKAFTVQPALELASPLASYLLGNLPTILLLFPLM